MASPDTLTITKVGEKTIYSRPDWESFRAYLTNIVFVLTHLPFRNRVFTDRNSGNVIGNGICTSNQAEVLAQNLATKK